MTEDRVNMLSIRKIVYRAGFNALKQFLFAVEGCKTIEQIADVLNKHMKDYDKMSKQTEAEWIRSGE